MDSQYKKIRLIFLLIIILPTVIFSIYEIGSYRDDEMVIETIYNNQLDAILYSINQYSNNEISSWAAKLDIICNENTDEFNEKFSALKREWPGVQSIYQFDNDFKPISKENTDSDHPELQQKIAVMLKDSSKIIKRMETYLRGGYRKIEPFDLKEDSIQLLVFLINAKDRTVINAFVLNPLQFIQNVLDPKIQEISQDKFYIGAFLNNKENVIYNSDKQNLKVDYSYSRPFWFFTNYYMGIELKDQTINQLVNTRTMKNVYSILIIDLVLLFGAWMIYRNLKKQMELASLKSDFISNVSHEIRTPLALISMYIETLDLNRVKTEEKKKEYYSVIYTETQRLSSLVNKILNFSQIDNEKRSYTFAAVSVNEVINEVVGTFKFHLDEKNFELKLALQNDIPSISADREALADAVVNLIDNAIKYSADEKMIAIKTGIQKDTVYIEISDKGIGISDSDQKKIFDKFYRVTEKNLAYKAKGSGLGLSIVKHVIDKHNGTIEVKSKLGEGTSFRLVFPVNYEVNS